MAENRLTAAGKELLKLNFGGALNAITKGVSPQSVMVDALDPATWEVSDQTKYFWENAFSSEHAFNYTGHGSSLKAYLKCPPLASVINKRAAAYINGKTWVMNTRGKEATSRDAEKIKALMNRPNPLQSWKQFEAQQRIYMDVFGWCAVLPIIPAGFEEYGPIEATSMWNIPPFMLEIKESGKLFYQLNQSQIFAEINLRYKDQKTKIDPSKIYFFKDFVPSMASLILPGSRIQPLEMPVNNIMGALESRYSLIVARGALGIFSNDPGSGSFGGMPLDPKEKEEIQKDFLRYGIKNKQWKFIITQASLRWQQVGIPTKELMLFEEIEDSYKMICEQYVYPWRLTSYGGGNSLGGTDAAIFERQLYQNAIIPDAESTYDQWNNFFRTDEIKLRIEKDYSHLPVLQKNAQEAATARETLNRALKMEFENGLITLDQWLEKLGEDPLPDGSGNVRVSDIKNSNIPLAVTIGVGGVQGLISLLTAQGMSDEARQAALEIVFGLSSDDARRMSQGSNNNQNEQPAGNQTGANANQ